MMADFTEDYEIFLDKMSNEIDTGMEVLFKVFDYIRLYPLEAFKTVMNKFIDLAKRLKRSEAVTKQYVILYGPLKERDVPK